MTEDDWPPIEDLEAWKARFGEYRHIPIVRYGAFRIDREWRRWSSHPERMWSCLQLVLEVDEYEFEMVGNLDLVRYLWFHVPLAKGQIPTRAQTLHIATRWWAGMRPTPDGGLVSLACYRRRVSPADDQHELTPGDWYIGPLFRRPSDAMISMAEAAPFVEAALRQLRQLEQAATGDETKRPSKDS